ncbi:MAG: DEAD/DEAH box helicase family protein [Methanobrevibacter sp.]|nr:DEAD/DEAH box helicase family protein [Candidatus Methanovirga meridionalis]
MGNEFKSKMEIKFNPKLKYQQDAVDSIVRLFEGENSDFTEFIMDDESSFRLNDTNHYSTKGTGNRLTISHGEILKNLNKIQELHKLPVSRTLGDKPIDFKIDMETGTGKTYVYLKTIFELNKRYNFNKFIIVVPGKAIKEGVNKSIKITEKHFKELNYNKIGNYFIYDSSKITNIKNFIRENSIQIMIITIDSFNKDINKIYNEHEDFNWRKPIEMIQQTLPVVIIDEPQSVVRTDKGKNSVKELNPIFTLSYSATHIDSQNLVYKLDSFDAYKQGLVKGIEVVSVDSLDFANMPYIKLLKTEISNSKITAQVEIYYFNNHRTLKKKFRLEQDDNLFYKSGEIEVYKNYIVDEISREEGNEYITFNKIKIKKGVPYGGTYDLNIKRVQIRRTIEEHLKKELKRLKEGIKVLSLFFIDEVKNYWDHDKNSYGKYGEIFEEEYEKLIKKPDYMELNEYLDFETPIHEVHDGYFAKDKKGRDINSKGKGESEADDSAYKKIMINKEQLLSMNEKLRFIFSHSALKEGWDNPNVFQICTLNETQSNDKKRQEIGRGMRLCVNQDGERITDKQTNRLTVMANESYNAFISSLQEDMAKELGIKFGIIEKEMFKDIISTPDHITDEKREEKIRKQGSLEIFHELISKNYINQQGHPTEKLKYDLKENQFKIDDKFKEIENDISYKIEKRIIGTPIKNASDKKEVKLNEDNFKKFIQIWNLIKQKTNYSIDFDTDKLISKCSDELSNINVSSPAIYLEKHFLDLKESGIEGNELESLQKIKMEDTPFKLPNILKTLQQETFLTRKTISQTLLKSESLNEFKKNPQEYKDLSLKIINNELNNLLLNQIKYTKINDYYSQEIFDPSEVYVYIENDDYDGAKVVKSQQSIYNLIKCDSKFEVTFAKKLEKNPKVITYTKLPNKFKIKTPIGNYNPDWAILINKDGVKTMYFVIETKGNVDDGALRGDEKDKIDCGKKHFKALDTNVVFKEVDSYEAFINLIE